MNKTKIEWCDYTWNPIKGLCPEACWYCYGRAMYNRFKSMASLVREKCIKDAAPAGQLGLWEGRT